MSEGDMEYLYRRKTGRMINALPAVNEVSSTEITQRLLVDRLNELGRFDS